MADYTDVIEKFLRGQMSQSEILEFHNKLKANNSIRLQAYAIVVIIKKHKNLQYIWKDGL